MPFFRRKSGGENERGKDEPQAGTPAPQPLPQPPSPLPPPALSPPLQLSAPPPKPELQAGEYGSSEEHLWDELRRIDQYVRAQMILWRATIGASKPEHMWGMVSVTDEEVNAYLRAPFLPFDYEAAGVEEEVAGFWMTAGEMRESINTRVGTTTPELVLRLEQLKRLFNLSEFERDVLLVLLLPELDGRYRRLFGYLQDDASRENPSVELVLDILRPIAPDAGSARAIFAATSSLIVNHLIVLRGDTESHAPLSVRSARVDDRVVGYLTGSDAHDARLEGILRRVDEPALWEDLLIEPERGSRLAALGEWWRENLREEGSQSATLFLHGSYGSSRLKAARAFCTAAEIPLLVADMPALMRSAPPDALLVDLAYREAKLQAAALYWSRCEQALEAANAFHAWEHLTESAEKFRGLTFVASSTPWEPAGSFRDSYFLRLDFSAPGYELRRRIWETHLPPAEQFAEHAPERSALADQLANGFQLTEGQIVDALFTAREQALVRDPGQTQITVADLYEGCRRQSNRSLAAFARRLEPRAGLSFDDLILPPPNKQQLDELRFRISQRQRVRGQFENRLTLGRGLIVLFTGSSGTGKTMAAGLLAHEQGVDLYKVDLSAVVSKYVGETEKNLSRVFAEAEDANAIIFFDEGEALFGQRGSKTETGQDRWANMEVNYLLQRIEEYTGVVILASNLRQNIDEAFMRRIHVVVEFPFPEAEARRRIWTGMFPEGLTRPPDEDIRALAERFRMPGGGISNIVVDAAFRARAEAPEGEPRITLRHLVLGVAREYQKMGQPITKGEFGETFYQWIQQDLLLGTAG
ncbi:MAG TPA: ATP-binding protein [Pyrinomonadaceae bacterium]|nr:ATP-binding protein [Pyrinomonadaceae bacterium]